MCGAGPSEGGGTYLKARPSATSRLKTNCAPVAGTTCGTLWGANHRSITTPVSTQTWRCYMRQHHSSSLGTVLIQVHRARLPVADIAHAPGDGHASPTSMKVPSRHTASTRSSQAAATRPVHLRPSFAKPPTQLATRASAETDDTHPSLPDFIDVIPVIGQNAAFHRRSDMRSHRRSASLSGKWCTPTPSDTSFPTPFCGPHVRGQLGVTQGARDPNQYGTPGCGPPLKLH